MQFNERKFRRLLCMNDIEYWSRFKNEEIFMWNDEEECFVRSEPGVGYFARFPGKKEYKISPNSKIVMMAIDSRNEITRQAYYGNRP